MKLTPEQFALVCYLVLMQGGAGLLDKHPSYIQEKLHVREMGYDAFGMLDIFNMRVLVNWAKKWGVELPEQVAEHYRLSEEAFAELRARGVEL